MSRGWILFSLFFFSPFVFLYLVCSLYAVIQFMFYYIDDIIISCSDYEFLVANLSIE